MYSKSLLYSKEHIYNLLTKYNYFLNISLLFGYLWVCERQELYVLYTYTGCICIGWRVSENQLIVAVICQSMEDLHTKTIASNIGTRSKLTLISNLQFFFDGLEKIAELKPLDSVLRKYLRSTVVAVSSEP